MTNRAGRAAEGSGDLSGEPKPEVSIPLLSNRRPFGTCGIVTAPAMTLVVLPSAVLFGSQGAWDAVLTMAWVFALVGLGFYILSLLVILKRVVRARLGPFPACGRVPAGTEMRVCRGR